MSQARINRASREAKRARSLGPDPSCLRCGYDDPDALGRDTDGVRCYECRRIGQNASGIERHHHLGRKTDPATIPVPGNLHRALSDAQLDHPEILKQGAQRDPLLWLAAGIRGLHDHLAWWVARLGAIADFLVGASAWIRATPATAGELASFPTLFGMRFR